MTKRNEMMNPLGVHKTPKMSPKRWVGPQLRNKRNRREQPLYEVARVEQLYDLQVKSAIRVNLLFAYTNIYI
jgi:hypothetical protein